MIPVLGEGGWFMFTTYQVDINRNGYMEWENPIDQWGTCDGDAQERSKPQEFVSRKHFARLVTLYLL